MIVLEHNIETNKAIERNATPEEIQRKESYAAEIAAKEQAELLKAQAKAALLERLGITADEAALLLA